MLYDSDDWRVINPSTVKPNDIIWVIKIFPPPHIAWIIAIKVIENNDYGVNDIIRGKLLHVEFQDKLRDSKIQTVDIYKTQYGIAMIGSEYSEYIEKHGIKVFAECPEHLRVLYEIK